MKKLFILTSIIILSLAYAMASVTLGFPGEKSASVGIYIKEIESGQVIASNNQDIAIVPASVMKTITAATALTQLGQNFRFRTDVTLTGDVAHGVCNGNLVIHSCGDPTIESSQFSDSTRLADAIANSLVERGVKTINGEVVVDETLSDAGCVSTWEIEDVPWPYGAGLYGFNFLDNVFELYPATGVTIPHVPNLNVKLVQSKSSNLRRGIDSNTLTVLNPKPRRKGWSVRTTMNHPAEVFKYQLESLLRQKGITVKNKKINSDKQLTVYTHYSPYLNDILTQTIVHSHNLFAEGVFRAICPYVSRDSVATIVTDIWQQRIPASDGNLILDGSGLSRGNRLSPKFLGDVLEWMARSDDSDTFTSYFPMVGEEGTVKNFLKNTPLEGKLILKTGSMNGVQCYAGYRIDQDGDPTHVVVIMVNGFRCSRADLRKSIEKLLLDNLLIK